MSSLIIIDHKSKMELILAQIVRLLAVTQPGQLQQMRRFAVRKINKDKAAIVGYLTVMLHKAKSLLIKFQAFLQIQYVKVVVRKSKFHSYTSLYNKIQLPATIGLQLTKKQPA